jgi:hypothetical protein
MCAGANVIERVGAFEEVGHANRLAISGIANEIGHADRRLPSYIGNLANAPTVTDMINPDHIPGSMPVTYFLCRRTGDVGSCQHPCLSLVEQDSSGPRSRIAWSKPVMTSL